MISFKNMSKMSFVLLLMVFSSLKVSAQSSDVSLNQLLQSYYSIKEALVAGKTDAAALAATSFTRNLNGVSYQLISEGNVAALLKDASSIADKKDITAQRKYFANLSSNMILVAKALKLTGGPVYIQYCPMKKAYWLSNENEIRNPYYGSSMLSCGSVTETLN